MGQPAARLTDMHVCPMLTPGVPPIPHVGGPITGPGAPTVLIGGMPAAVMGDMCVCVGPPDTIILGSTGVFICKKPAARMGNSCAHGGTIILGCPTVLIGETGGCGGGGIAAMPVNVIVDLMGSMPVAVKNKMSQIAAFKVAADAGSPLVTNTDDCTKCVVKPEKVLAPVKQMPAATQKDKNQIAAMKVAANSGAPLVQDTDKCKQCGTSPGSS